MPRIKLNELPVYPFSTEIPVRITDINYGGHLGNDSLLSLIHEARIQFLASLGYSELDCGGVSLIMTDSAIVYKTEVFAGDVLKFEIGAYEISRTGFRISYKITKRRDNVLAALAETGMLAFDYKNKKLSPLPKPTIERLRSC